MAEKRRVSKKAATMKIDKNGKREYTENGTCITVGDQNWNAGPRVAQMIEWLLEHADEIEQMNRVRISFNCQGRAVSTELSQTTRL